MEKDFIRDRLIPFFIGLGVIIGLSVLYGVLYIIALALAFAGGFGAAASGNPAAAIIGVLVGVPLWLLICAVSLAFWLLTTWLLGKWTQETYRAYRQKRRSYHSREEYFADRREKQRQDKYDREFRQQEEWEAEWNAMKKQEKENFSSRKPENRQETVMNPLEPEQNPEAKGEIQ